MAQASERRLEAGAEGGALRPRSCVWVRAGVQGAAFQLRCRRGREQRSERAAGRRGGGPAGPCWSYGGCERSASARDVAWWGPFVRRVQGNTHVRQCRLLDWGMLRDPSAWTVTHWLERTGRRVCCRTLRCWAASCRGSTARGGVVSCVLTLKQHRKHTASLGGPACDGARPPVGAVRGLCSAGVSCSTAVVARKGCRWASGPGLRSRLRAGVSTGVLLRCGSWRRVCCCVRLSNGAAGAPSAAGERPAPSSFPGVARVVCDACCCLGAASV